MPQLRYSTPHGIAVTRHSSKIHYARGLGQLLKQLDRKRGVYLSSGYEYPERYSRWDVASIATTLTSWLAIRKLSSESSTTLRANEPTRPDFAAHRLRLSRSRPLATARKSSPIIRRKSTWRRSRLFGKGCVRAIITKLCCGRHSVHRLPAARR